METINHKIFAQRKYHEELSDLEERHNIQNYSQTAQYID